MVTVPLQGPAGHVDRRATRLRLIDLCRSHPLYTDFIHQPLCIHAQRSALLVTDLLTTYRPLVFWTIFSFVVLAVVALSGASVVIYTMGNGIPRARRAEKSNA